jgi:Leucine-rich repeat (LRR) protein
LTELLASKNSLEGTLFLLEVSMPRLQHLDIASNAVSSLQSSHSLDLPALKILNVSSNRLSSLPDLSPCKELLTLLAEGNALTSLPGSFTQLPKLRSADFTANNLTKLDDEIAFMDQLETLRLGANPLRERKLLNLTTDEVKSYFRGRLEARLDSTDNGHEPNEKDREPNSGAAMQPSSSWILKTSGVLSFSSDFRSETEREAFGEFVASNQIRQINMNNMHLKNIPLVLERVLSLQILDLSNNEIEDVSTAPLRLPALSELRLASNKITSLDRLMKFLYAPNLQRLDVSCNQIKGPLPCMRATFPALRVLIASDNQLSEVTAESLRGFTTASLSRNDIAHLPPEIGLLSDTLVNFDVDANMFRVPSHRILEKGTQAVLAWLRDKIPN